MSDDPVPHVAASPNALDPIETAAISLNFQQLNPIETEDSHVQVSVTGGSGFAQRVQLTRQEALHVAQAIIKHWPASAKHFGIIA